MKINRSYSASLSMRLLWLAVAVMIFAVVFLAGWLGYMTGRIEQAVIDKVMLCPSQIDKRK